MTIHHARQLNKSEEKTCEGLHKKERKNLETAPHGTDTTDPHLSLSLCRPL